MLKMLFMVLMRMVGCEVAPLTSSLSLLWQFVYITQTGDLLSVGLILPLSEGCDGQRHLIHPLDLPWLLDLLGRGRTTKSGLELAAAAIGWCRVGCKNQPGRELWAPTSALIFLGDGE
jgi:hypothetical protein